MKTGQRTERDAKPITPSDDPVLNKHQGAADTQPTPTKAGLKHSSTPQGTGPGEVHYPAEE